MRGLQQLLRRSVDLELFGECDVKLLGSQPPLLLVVLLVAAGGSSAASKQRIPAAATSGARVLQKRASTGSRATGPAGEWWKVWWQNYIPEVTDPTAVPHLTTPTPEDYGPEPRYSAPKDNVA
ncbi:hypothetical protein HPB50_004632 [Hyalomma asiaticum]|uniref:Uncharacterized protein n=1 Tax=Hyalomma asiaticum TaxID=266040 RepID=A0ACB7TH85_HYAAI|nr:hypothetical protein HPB50_004632 [Hyalomma asiaticum]